MKIKYFWKRFWAPFGSQISLADNGFLYHPEDSLGKYINPDIKTLDDLKNVKCLILLGEPGIGKSTEIKGFYDKEVNDHNENNLFINLGNIPTFDYFIKELESDSKYQGWLTKDKQLYLFLDSFDEGVFEFKSFANFFIHFLNKNVDKLDHLFIRISCRTAIWPFYFENNLKEIFEKDSFKKYELCPLTKNDVKNALKTHRIEINSFIKELNDKNAISLAIKPLTLDFLINIYKGNDVLPSKKEEIYRKGCNLLVEEWDESKKKSLAMKPKLTLMERIILSERIAAVTIFGNKQSIVIRGRAMEKEIHISELFGKEKIEDSSFNFEENEILEVLNTGLFSARGDNRIGWAHQTYGEFLAANCLIRHKLNWEQIKKIIFQDLLGNNTFQTIPQLYEAGAWLANLDSNFFNKAVLIDPEFLMLSDNSVISNSQKKILVEQLLKLLAKGEIIDRNEIFNYSNYRKLDYPGIEKLLEKYIKDPENGVVVRRVAIDIALACSINAIENLFISIALNNKENLAIRIEAIRAIAKNGSNKARKALQPLINTGFYDDPEDELKGITLQAMWPNHITTEKLFSLLTPPKRHSFLGAYYGFTERHLVNDIPAKDITIALDWILANAIHERTIEYYLGKLADEIMLKAWENLTLPGVLERFSRIVYERLIRFESIVGNHAADNEIINSFQGVIEAQDDKRKKFIKAIIELLIKEKGKDIGRKGYFLLPHGNRIKLVFSKDLPWLIDWLDKDKNEETQKLLAEVIWGSCDIRTIRDIGLIYKARNRNGFLKQETVYWFEPVKLDSEDARERRKRWQQEKEWEKKRNKDEKEEILKFISPEKIRKLLEKAESGDTDSWWRLNNAMCLYQHEWSEEDIHKLPGWKVIDETTQKRIIKAGKQFILEQESKPEKWLGKENVIYFPAMSGYRALKIYFERDKTFIEGLGKEIWKKWAPITVGMPLISNDPENGKLITVAYKNAPDEIIKTINVLIDEDEKKHNGNLLLIDLLDGCVDVKMSQFLLTKAKKLGFKPVAIGDIIGFLLKHKIQLAKDYAKSLIQVPLSKEPEKREISLIAAVSLMWNAEPEDWNYLWKLIQKNNEFGQLLVEKAHSNPLRGSSLLQRLNEKQLSRLFIWLMKEFPPEKYFQPVGGFAVTPQISIAEWRESVLRVLMEKGTPESFKEMGMITKALPKYKWIKEFTLPQTKKIVTQKSWKPISIKEVNKILLESENDQLRANTKQRKQNSNKNIFEIGYGWSLRKNVPTADLYDGKNTRYTFKKTWTIQYKIFEYICKKNRFVKYEELDKNVNNKKSLEVIGNEHKNMERQMQLLKKKLKKAGIDEFTIEISGGFQLKFNK